MIRTRIGIHVFAACCLLSGLLVAQHSTGPQEVRPLFNRPSGYSAVINGVSVPDDFPRLTIDVSNNSDSGKIFLATTSGTPYLMILKNDGTPYFYQRFSDNQQLYDFKVQPTGTLTAMVFGDINGYIEMDSTYTPLDTLRCTNGYITDFHDCLILPDHHYFLIGDDFKTFDSTALGKGSGGPTTVIGNVLQEFDKDHQLVFEWKSWDYFKIADAVHENLNSSKIDYVHMNSVALDYDSNIIISSRHLSEITKINRTTGAIMWRLGGVNNEFTFSNDSVGFSYQHDAQPVPGKPGNYTVFDDGNYHTPQYSRVVEYHIDTAAMTATLVWQYRHDPDFITTSLGNAQRLPGGNTFICWGSPSLPKAFEVTPEGAVLYSANFDPGLSSYRGFRFNWNGVAKIPYLIAESYPDRVALIFNKFGDTHVERYVVYGGISPLSIAPIDSTTATQMDLTDIQNDSYHYFRVVAVDSNGTRSDYSNEEKVFVHFTLPGENLVRNGDFSSDNSAWTLDLSDSGSAAGMVTGGEYAVAITNGGSTRSSVRLSQSGIPLEFEKPYSFEFDAYATADRVIDARIEQDGGSHINYSHTSTLVLSTVKTHKKFDFIMSDPSDDNASVSFNVGFSADTVYIDNVSIREILSDGVETQNQNPDEFILEQNFPNPFNPVTTIRFRLPSVSAQYNVEMKICDIVGRTVSTLVQGELSAGTHTAQWNGAAAATGVYYCELTVTGTTGTPSFHSVKKILLLK